MSKSSTRVITGVATLSYPHLDKAQPGMNGGKAKYSATLVFAPGADLSALEAAVIAAAEEKWGAKAKEMLRTTALKSPFRKDAEAKGYPAGSVFINCRSESQPGTVTRYKDENGKPIAIPQDKIKTELYPGAQVRASVTAFPYDTSGNKGVSFALNNIQKMGEGDRLDNRVAAENEFDADLSQEPVDISGLV